MDDKVFEIICKHKDTNPSNLNKVFDSYGCNTLEAKVPVVDERIVDKLMGIRGEQQLYASLSLKADSSNLALEGRAPRTKNKVLKVVEVNGEMMIATGESRDRSPVAVDELDEEIEEYMKEGARLKATRLKSDTPDLFPELVIKAEKKSPIDVQTSRMSNLDLQDEMDKELDAYMQEAARLRRQKKELEKVQTDRMDAMTRMEEDFDFDNEEDQVRFEF